LGGEFCGNSKDCNRGAGGRVLKACPRADILGRKKQIYWGKRNPPRGGGVKLRIQSGGEQNHHAPIPTKKDVQKKKNREKKRLRGETIETKGTRENF